MYWFLEWTLCGIKIYPEPYTETSNWRSQLHFQLLGWPMGPVYVPTVDMTQYMQQAANIVKGLSLRVNVD